MNKVVAAVVAAMLVAFGFVIATAASSAPKPSPTMLSAVVDVESTTQQATLVRGNGVVSAVWIGTDGFYHVTFDRDVSQCAYVATAGVSSAFTIADDDIILNVEPALDNNTGLAAPNAVTVEEWDGGTNTPHGTEGFHLIVEC
jgi:hypothetical protein